MPRRKRQDSVKPDAIAAWAQRDPYTRGQCCVCEVEEIRRAVDAIIAVRHSGVKTKSQPEIYAKLREVYPDWRGTRVGMREHIKNHTKGWNRRG